MICILKSRQGEFLPCRESYTSNDIKSLTSAQRKRSYDKISSNSICKASHACINMESATSLARKRSMITQNKRGFLTLFLLLRFSGTHKRYSLMIQGTRHVWFSGFPRKAFLNLLNSMSVMSTFTFQ